jgi:hypothetical protein
VALFSPFQQPSPATGFDPGLQQPGIEYGATGGNRQQQNPRRRNAAVDQIMAGRQGSAQNINAFRLGGPEYLDFLQQMQQNATWY